MRQAHSPLHLKVVRAQRITLAGLAAAATWTFGFGYVSWGKELFAELDVDGLGTFTTAIRLGFEGHALAFIHGGKA